VLAHELGHLRGLGHYHGDARAVMSATLPHGVRRLPQAAVDQVFERSAINRFLASKS